MSPRWLSKLTASFSGSNKTTTTTIVPQQQQQQQQPATQRPPVKKMSAPVSSEPDAVGTVLITGGTGYIGSFTTLALLEHGYHVVIVDSLYNSSRTSLDRIEIICGKRPDFYQVDITDENGLDKVFAAHPKIDSVIHFAALKAVGESSEIPLEYYRVAVGGTISLLRCMTKHNVTNIVFSSSATVYGDVTRIPDMIPIPEHCPLGPTNPYGRTKSTVELLITDHIEAQRNNAKKQGKEEEAKKWNGALLRYFNPAGSHPSGIMGEDPLGVPFNLLPLLGQVATGQREKLLVFGDDYPSRDGTAIRDYIHVIDLAQGHLAALNHLRTHSPGVRAWNLGSGRGCTVFEMVSAFSHAVGTELKYEVVARRAGDVLDLTANPKRANEELGWKTELTLEDACQDLWRWVKNNPRGYRQDAPEELIRAAEEKREARARGKQDNGNGNAVGGSSADSGIAAEGSTEEAAKTDGVAPEGTDVKVGAPTTVL